MTATRRWTPVMMMITALTLFGTGSAAAQQPPVPPTSQAALGSWSITPFAGFGFSGDLDSPTGALGVAGGRDWNSNVSLEGEFNLLPSSENGGVVEVSSNAWSLTGNLLYHFAPRTFRPYAVIGMGFGHTTVDADETGQVSPSIDETSNEFVVNLGGGIERAIRQNIRFRGDMLYFFGGDLVPDYWRLSAGLQFGLGRR